MVQSANRPTSKRSQFSKLNAIFICNLCKLSWSARQLSRACSLQRATCSLQRAACCSLGTLKSSLSHHQLSSTELAPQSWLLSGTQRHLTTNICDIKCCNRGTVCLAVAVASAAAASLSSHPATRRAHFTNLMKTFAVARPGLACPIVSRSLSLSICASAD